MTRTIRHIKQARLCEACKAQGVTTLATHSTTDSREIEPGVYEETGARYGCKQHPVTPEVYTLSGERVSFDNFN
jgi:hypothetical protein